MAEEMLQGLLDKINEEGIKKADAEKEKIISDAKAEAEKIISQAKSEADSIKKKAEEDATNSESRAKAAIQQAARDIILSLKEDLLSRLNKVVKNSIGDAMTPEVMGQTLLEMAKSYREQNPDSEPGIEVLITKNDLEKIEKLFKGSLVNDLKESPDISIGHDFGSGLKIGFKGSDVFFDFSDDAISDLICQFIGPKLTAMLNPEKSE
jgi:V/A-type H+-transporting ATPase subunit E